jgi:hypothetical protein
MTNRNPNIKSVDLPGLFGIPFGMREQYLTEVLPILSGWRLGNMKRRAWSLGNANPMHNVDSGDVCTGAVLAMLLDPNIDTQQALNRACDRKGMLAEHLPTILSIQARRIHRNKLRTAAGNRLGSPNLRKDKGRAYEARTNGGTDAELAEYHNEQIPTDGISKYANTIRIVSGQNTEANNPVRILIVREELGILHRELTLSGIDRVMLNPKARTDADRMKVQRAIRSVAKRLGWPTRTNREQARLALADRIQTLRERQTRPIPEQTTLEYPKRDPNKPKARKIA